MIRFTLMLSMSVDSLGPEISEEESDFVDKEINKAITLPALPRVGEQIDVGNAVTVESVCYDIEDDTIEVVCDSHLFDCVVAFVTCKGGWNLEGLGTPGKKLFLERVKKFRKQQQNNK